MSNSPTTAERRSSRPKSQAVRFSRRIATKAPVIAFPVVAMLIPIPIRTVATGAAKGNLFTKRSGSAISATSNGNSQPGPLLIPSTVAEASPSTTPPRARSTAAVSTHQTRRNCGDPIHPATVASVLPLGVIPQDDCRRLTNDALRYIVIHTQERSTRKEPHDCIRHSPVPGRGHRRRQGTTHSSRSGS